MGCYEQNDLTNSVKALKKIGSKDQASISSGPPTTLTIIQLCSKKQKHTKYTQINANKSTHSEMGPV